MNMMLRSQRGGRTVPALACCSILGFLAALGCGQQPRRPERRESRAFFETVALNRGLRCQAFNSMSEAGAWLDRLGATAFADRVARELSGGERRRVAIARALTTPPTSGDTTIGCGRRLRHNSPISTGEPYILSQGISKKP